MERDVICGKCGNLLKNEYACCPYCEKILEPKGKIPTQYNQK